MAVIIIIRDLFTKEKREKLIHSADPQSRPIVIIVFAHVVRPFVPTFQNETNFKRKQWSLLARLWVWPSGSLKTPSLAFFVFKHHEVMRVLLLFLIPSEINISSLYTLQCFFIQEFLAKEIKTRQESSMIHSTRPTVWPVFSFWNLFYFARF